MSRKSRVAWAGAVLASMSFSAAMLQDLPLSRMKADAHAALYAFYASPAERSSFWIDEAYRLHFDEEAAPLSWEGEAGSLSFAWKQRRRLTYRIGDYARPPRVLQSYSDAGSLAYSPMEGLEVTHDFAVFSSGMLNQKLTISNTSRRTREFQLFAVYSRPTPMKKPQLKGQKDAFFFKQKAEWPGTKAQRKGRKFPRFLENMILLSQEADSWGAFADVAEFLSRARQIRPVGEEEAKKTKKPTILTISTTLRIPAGESRKLGLIRSIGQSRGLMWTQGTRVLLNYPFERLFQESRERYSQIPAGSGQADDDLYWQSWSILEQSMIQTDSRGSAVLHVPARTRSGRAQGQALWDGWSMVAYAKMNCDLARNSRRALIAAQGVDGALPSDLGPLSPPLNRSNAVKRPFFSWVNSRIQEACPDDDFLEQAYDAGDAWVGTFLQEHDSDADGLVERTTSGPTPVRMEVVDLNALLVREMESLASMAGALDFPKEAADWTRKADQLSNRINSTLWDSGRGAYRDVDANSQEFFEAAGNGGGTMSLMGFLPLWAGIVPPERRPILIAHLTDTNLFARPYGLPGLSFNSTSGSSEACGDSRTVDLRCNYWMVLALVDAGEMDAARELVKRLQAAAVLALSKDRFIPTRFDSESGRPASDTSRIGGGLLGDMLRLTR